MTNSKLTPCCAYCEHCGYEDRHHWSTITGSDPAHWFCKQGHYTYNGIEEMIEGAMFRIAQNCGDFQLSSKVIKEVAKELKRR